jgi:hypothetical protein
MKNRYFILAFLIFCNSVGWGQKYFPFPTENVTWNVFLIFSCNDDFPPDTFLLRYALHGDTIINQVAYNKLCLENGDKSNPKITSIGGLREDAKKIYFIGMDFIGISTYEEFLLYDFSMQVDDTVKHDNHGVFYSVIKEIDSIKIGEEYRKRYKVDNHWFYHNPDYWVEGIGSIQNGLLGHITNIPTCGYSYWENICFIENSKVMYLNPSFAECYPDNLMKSIDDWNIKPKIEIFPNPITREININNIHPGSKLQVKIIDILGRIVTQKELSSTDNVIQISNRGSLIILITNNKGQIIESKLIMIK